MPVLTPPPAGQVTGADVLSAATRLLRRFVWFSRPEYYDLVALWATQTWVHDAFDFSARLHFGSTEPGSGKTHAMDMTGLLCRDTLYSAGMSAASLRIAIASEHPVIALDEVDVIFGATKGKNADLRAILNAGYDRRGVIITATSNGHEYRKWQVYGPVMLAGLGTLPATLADRGFTIAMSKPPKGQRPEKYHLRVHEPQMLAAGQALGEWARSVAPELADIIPAPIGDLDMRAEAVSEPLLILGHLAGGDWPDRARAALTAVFTDAGDPAAIEIPLDVRLLRDIHAVFTGPRMATSALVRALLAIPAAPWAQMWTEITAPAQLAGMLAPFGIRPAAMRVDGDTRRAYDRAGFTEAWQALTHA
jgi:Protein of unknown function (DUF3631)